MKTVDSPIRGLYDRLQHREKNTYILDQGVYVCKKLLLRLTLISKFHDNAMRLISTHLTVI